ncbi:MULTISPECIES: hypothetical protein [unclassified Enterobacter]|uniref:hypothetical protein n=1 Tax=unclassified Enterobacter TaxID=2608935 RepID=UPI0008EF79E7|nr:MULTISPECIES: hypothetical protein [unclassified Enterobacter]SFR14173.1 hypothetical protein SAMN04487773_3330 [Enterobacter sp. kpr-6]
MSKKQKKNKPVAVKVPVMQPEAAHVRLAFGYDEMLSELEAIVADAEVRLSEEEAA